MSTTKLTVFSSFTVQKKGAIKVFYGASDARVEGEGEDAKRILEMGSVPIDGGLRAPEGGLLMLYGFRDNIEELRQRRARARDLGADFHYAEVVVDVGDITVGLVDRRGLKGLRFANVKRMTAGLQSNILLEFSRYVEEEGGSEDEEMSKIQQIAQRPDLFCKLLDNDPDMRSLEVLVIPVADDPKFPGRVRQLAYVRQGAAILKVEQNTEINRFELPAWMNIPRRTALRRAAKTTSVTGAALASPAQAAAPKAAVKSAPKVPTKSARNLS